MDDKQFKKDFKAMDKDKSGSVEYFEFQRWFCAQEEEHQAKILAEQQATSQQDEDLAALSDLDLLGEFDDMVPSTPPPGAAPPPSAMDDDDSMAMLEALDIGSADNDQPVRLLSCLNAPAAADGTAKSLKVGALTTNSRRALG